MATTRTTDCHNDYWKLDFRNYMSAKTMRALLEERKYSVGSTKDKECLKEAMRRSILGLRSYRKCSNDELRRLVIARKTDMFDYINKRHLGQRGDLLESLEREDLYPKFHRFTQLPAELRSEIYIYHLADFGKPIYAPSQPPLSKTCSLIRKEFLPLFYDRCCFEIQFSRRTNDEQPLAMCHRMMLWLLCTSQEHIASIKHLHLSSTGSPRPYRTSHETLYSIYLDCNGSEPSVWSYETYFTDAKTPAEVAREKSMERAIRAVMKKVAKRAGKDNLRSDDIFDLRRALEVGYESA